MTIAATDARLNRKVVHMGNMLFRIGSVAARRPWRILLIWVAVAAAILAVRSAWGGEPVDSFDLPGAESQHAVELIEDRFPGLTGTTSRIVFHSEAARLDSPANSAAIADVIARARRLEDVSAVSDPLAQDTAALSSDGLTAYATISYAVRFDALTSEDFAAVVAAGTPARDVGLQVEVGGAVADFGDTDSQGNEGIGLLIAVIVLILALGSVTAMLLPISLALFTMAVGIGLLGLLAAFSQVPKDTTTLATMIGLGVGIDYALFVLTRYRQFVAAGIERPAAIARANGTAGQAVVFAGITVLIAIIGFRASGLPAIAMMGYGTALFVALAVLAAVTLLPALLALTGARIDGLLARTRRKRVAAARHPDADDARWSLGEPRRTPPRQIRSRRPRRDGHLGHSRPQPAHRVLRCRGRVDRSHRPPRARPARGPRSGRASTGHCSQSWTFAPQPTRPRPPTRFATSSRRSRR